MYFPQHSEHTFRCRPAERVAVPFCRWWELKGRHLSSDAYELVLGKQDDPQRRSGGGPASFHASGRSQGEPRRTGSEHSILASLRRAVRPFSALGLSFLICEMQRPLR